MSENKSIRQVNDEIETIQEEENGNFLLFTSTNLSIHMDDETDADDEEVIGGKAKLLYKLQRRRRRSVGVMLFKMNMNKQHQTMMMLQIQPTSIATLRIVVVIGVIVLNNNNATMVKKGCKIPIEMVNYLLKIDLSLLVVLIMP